MDIVQETYAVNRIDSKLSRGDLTLAIDRAFEASYRRWCQHYLATPALHVRNGADRELMAPCAKAWGLAASTDPRCSIGQHGKRLVAGCGCKPDSSAAAIWAQVRRERSQELARELRPLEIIFRRCERCDERHNPDQRCKPQGGEP